MFIPQPHSHYKGIGMLGSVAPYPLNPYDITQLPYETNAELASLYGGIENLYPFGIGSNPGSIVSPTVTSLGGFVSKYAIWIAGAAGFLLMINMNKRQPSRYGR